MDRSKFLAALAAFVLSAAASFSVVHADDGVENNLLQAQVGQPGGPERAPPQEKPQQPEKGQPSKPAAPQPQPANQQNQGQTQQQQQAMQQGQTLWSQQVSQLTATTDSSAGAYAGSSSGASSGSSSRSGDSAARSSASGGKSSSTSAGGAGGSTGPISTAGGSSTAGGGTGTGGALNQINTDNSHFTALTAEQLGNMPTQFHDATVSVEKAGTCGRRIKVKKVNDNLHLERLFGVFVHDIAVETMDGILDETGEQPEPFKMFRTPMPHLAHGKWVMGELVQVIGHQQYIVKRTLGMGNSNTIAGNFAGERAWAAGMAGSVSGQAGAIRVFAIDCVFRGGETSDEEEAPPAAPPVTAAPTPPVVAPAPAPAAPAPTTAPTVKVLSAAAKEKLVKDDTTPKTCEGKVIPPGFHCSLIRPTVDVVKCDANNTVAGATCVAPPKN